MWDSELRGIDMKIIIEKDVNVNYPVVIFPIDGFMCSANLSLYLLSFGKNLDNVDFKSLEKIDL